MPICSGSLCLRLMWCALRRVVPKFVIRFRFHYSNFSVVRPRPELLLCATTVLWEPHTRRRPTISLPISFTSSRSASHVSKLDAYELSN
ncbi:hypothetical protein BGW80DRAFT_1360033 [Lactifluus volemus]|nr:hypothetical protein BGW80DRAFT_1360033 [Lactifluus volemus]